MSGGLNTDRSRLPSSPAEPPNLRITFIKGAGPLLAALVLTARRDALVQSERPWSGSDHVEDRDRLANTDYADAPAGTPIDETLVSESFRYRSEKGGGCIPYRAIRARARWRTMVVEAERPKRAVGPPGVPTAMGRVVEAYEQVSRGNPIQPGPRRQYRRRRRERQGRKLCSRASSRTGSALRRRSSSIGGRPPRRSDGCRSQKAAPVGERESC
jgi:hypothetical protein